MNRSRRTAIGALVIGLIAVVVVSMWVSWTALSDLAAHTGLEKARNGFPLVVDGMILLAVGAALLMRGRKGYGWAISAIIGYTLASLVLNFLHARGEGGTLTAGDWARVSVIAAAPVLTNALGTHLVVLVLRLWDARPAEERTEGTESGILRAARTWRQVRDTLTVPSAPEDVPGTPAGDAPAVPADRSGSAPEGNANRSGNGRREHPGNVPEEHGNTPGTPAGNGVREHREHSAGNVPAQVSEAGNAGNGSGEERRGTPLGHLPDDELVSLALAFDGQCSARRIAREFRIGNTRAAEINRLVKEAEAVPE